MYVFVSFPDPPHPPHQQPHPPHQQAVHKQFPREVGEITNSSRKSGISFNRFYDKLKESKEEWIC